MNVIKDDLMQHNPPIRVLCVMSTLDRGGAESMCMNLYRHIDRNKVQFDFVKHTYAVGEFEDEITSLGGCIYAAPRLKPYNYLKYCRWWERHLDEHQEHRIIHGHFFSISAVYFRVAKRKGRITVGHIHASAADSWFKEFLESRISKYTDIPFACSEEAGKWIYGNRKFRVLKNALDLKSFAYNCSIRNKMRKQLGIESELVLGTVANLSSVKNPMGLIDIFLDVRKRNSNTKLLWVGEGAQRSVIEERIKQEEINNDVQLLGTRNDVPNLLQAMDVFLLPSFSEGLPVSIIEAQASGLPCYMSNKITREADVTGNCLFLPIDEPGFSAIWADEIIHNTTVRRDTSECVRKAGYDITATSKWLQKFYLYVESDNWH